ncbi:DUF4097 family beta strand repeat protein [Coprothermobacteraceae bacterium]|nr:DUF4097 family beta strand repeat protein [Coprothermobacteraceae bacterium]
MKVRKTFAFTVAEKRLAISAISADLKISSNDTQQLLIEVELEGDEDKIQGYAPKIRRTDEEIEVELEYWDIPKVLLLKPRREPKVLSATISIPSVDSVSFSAVGGDISAAGIRCQGASSSSTVSGDIVLTRVQADSVVAKSAAGDVSVTEVTVNSTLRVSTVSGDVIAEKVSFTNGAFETVAGDIRINFAEPRFKLLELKTVSGDVAVKSPSLPPCRVEYSSLTGTVRVGGQRFKGSQGSWSSTPNPTALIKVSTVSGLVNIESQNQQDFDPKAQAIVELLQAERITKEQARELLAVLGYSEAEIEKLLHHIK